MALEIGQKLSKLNYCRQLQHGQVNANSQTLVSLEVTLLLKTKMHIQSFRHIKDKEMKVLNQIHTKNNSQLTKQSNYYEVLFKP